MKQNKEDMSAIVCGGPDDHSVVNEALHRRINLL